MSIEEILADDGANSISERVTGKKIALPVAIDRIDPEEVMARVRDKAGDGLKILGRGFGFAAARLGTLADGLKQSAKKRESQDKE